MSLAATSQFTTGGAISYRWYDNRKQGVIKEKVTATGYTPSLTLANQIPANSRIIMAAMRVSSSGGANILLGSSAAATAGQAGAALIIGTAPTSLTTSLTTANFAVVTAQSAFGAAIPSNSNAIRAWDATAAATNGLVLPTTLNLPATLQNTAAQSVYVVPYAATTAANATQRFQVATGTAATVATTGYVFNTSTSGTCSFDVEIFFETYTDTPSY